MKFYYKGRRLLGVILLSLGIGILLVIILPFWGWLAIAGVGMICMGWYYFRH